MSVLQRHVRKFLAFVISSCTIGLSGPGYALHGVEQFTSTPEAPEAYQPFTLDLISVCPHFSDLDVIQVDVFPGTYTIRVNAGDSRICWDPPPVSPKKASVLGLPGGTYSIQQSVMLDDSSVGFPEIGTITVAPAPPTPSSRSTTKASGTTSSLRGLPKRIRCSAAMEAVVGG